MSDPEASGRIALGVEYDGTDFLGWQRQQAGRSVQAVLEEALSVVADGPVRVICAGRTDAGVHARGQVVHFDSGAPRSERSWVLGSNANLPADVAVLWARRVPADFHARYRATQRRYRYLVTDRPVRTALDRAQVAWFRGPLDVAAMREAAGMLLGEHDFSAFRAAGCQARSPIRTLQQARVCRDGSVVAFDFAANAFLHRMVRNLVGSLIAVGQGKCAPEWLAEVLRARDRTRAGIAAPACGLTLCGVEYPARYALPSTPVRERTPATLGL